MVPPLTAAGGRGDVRRGRGAGDAGAVGLQPRQRRRGRRLPDGGSRPGAPVHRDGLAPHPRGVGGRGRARGVRRGLRHDVQPRRGASGGASRPRAPARTASRCCTTARRRRSARRSTRWVRARRCWSTPTTCTPRCGPPSRSRGPGWARCGWTPATSGCSPRRSGPSSTSSAPPGPASWSPATSTSTRSPRSPRHRSNAYGFPGTQLVTGSGHPTSGLVYKLVAREGRGRRAGRGRQAPAPARTPTAAASGRAPRRGRPRHRRGRRHRRSPRDPSLRDLLVPLGARRRGRRRRGLSTGRASATPPCGPSCRRPRPGCRAARRCCPPSTPEDAA